MKERELWRPFFATANVGVRPLSSLVTLQYTPAALKYTKAAARFVNAATRFVNAALRYVKEEDSNVNAAL